MPRSSPPPKGHILTPSQEETRGKDLGRAEESRELEEELEVRSDSPLFQQDVVLTPSQIERRGAELNHEKEGRGAGGRKEQPNVCCDPASSDRALF